MTKFQGLNPNSPKSVLLLGLGANQCMRSRHSMISKSAFFKVDHSIGLVLNFLERNRRSSWRCSLKGTERLVMGTCVTMPDQKESDAYVRILSCLDSSQGLRGPCSWAPFSTFRNIPSRRRSSPHPTSHISAHYAWNSCSFAFRCDAFVHLFHKNMQWTDSGALFRVKLHIHCNGQRYSWSWELLVGWDILIKPFKWMGRIVRPWCNDGTTPAVGCCEELALSRVKVYIAIAESKLVLDRICACLVTRGWFLKVRTARK